MFACLVRETAVSQPAQDGRPAAGSGLLESIARACSPRVETHGEDAVIFDADGLSRVCGPPPVIAEDVMALAATQSIVVRVALADTKTAAWLLAHARPGTTIVATGDEKAALASLPVGWLGAVVALDEERLTSNGLGPTQEGLTPSGLRPMQELKRGRAHDGGRGGRHHFRLAPSPAAARVNAARPGVSKTPTPVVAPAIAKARAVAEAECRERLATFERWGLRTLGDVAALPRGDLHARMGPMGVRLHQAACGEDVTPLVPADEVVPFADRLELEWPIDELEPLSFVLARQFDRLSSVLEHADRGAVVVTTRLTLTTREVHERTLHLPAPMRDARVLRTLVLLDLESHPPPAGVDVVEVILGVTPGRIVQGSLLERSLPSPEDVATLLARLGALMGESRIGAPVLLDTHDARPVAMKPFRIRTAHASRLTSNAERLTSNGSAPGTRNPEPGIRNLEPRTWNQEPRTRNPEPGTRNAERRTPHAERLVFRRFPLPLAVQVTTDRGGPARVSCAARGLGGEVIQRAGPWRTSGAWWVLDGSGGWNRDEWDVELASGTVCRLTRHRVSGTWDLEGIFD